MNSNENKEKESILPRACGEVCTVWSRITGYYRPTTNWNKGKLQEFQERKHFNVKNAR